MLILKIIYHLQAFFYMIWLKILYRFGGGKFITGKYLTFRKGFSLMIDKQGEVIIGNKAILSITEKEGNSGSTKSWQALIGAGEFVTVATISEVATFVNADNSTVAAATNKTYNYNNGTWQ